MWGPKSLTLNITFQGWWEFTNHVKAFITQTQKYKIQSLLFCTDIINNTFNQFFHIRGSEIALYTLPSATLCTHGKHSPRITNLDITDSILRAPTLSVSVVVGRILSRREKTVPYFYQPLTFPVQKNGMPKLKNLQQLIV